MSVAGRALARSHPVSDACPAGRGLAPESRALLVALFLVLSCTSYVVGGGGLAGADYQLRWAVLGGDLVLALIAFVHLRDLRSVWRDRSAQLCSVAALALGVSLVPSLLANPSERGAVTLLRWFGTAMLAVAFGRLSAPGRRLVVGVFAATTSVQVGVALAQRLNGGPLGVGGIGEAGATEIGGRYASSGLTVHPYVFAAWCALAAAVLLAAVVRGGRRVPGWVQVAAAIACGGVGLTQSRTGAIATALVLGCLVLAAGRRSWVRPLAAGAVVALTVGVALNLSGWVERAADTSPGSASGGIGSNRGQLVDQAEGLFGDHPVLGVGPGRYVEELVEHPDLVELATQKPSRPVHMVPFLLLVEGGLAILPALVLLGWAVISRMRRGGIVGVAVGLSVMPFLLLDHLHWSFPQGLMLTALWLGTLDQLGRRSPP